MEKLSDHFRDWVPGRIFGEVSNCGCADGPSPYETKRNIRDHEIALALHVSDRPRTAPRSDFLQFKTRPEKNSRSFTSVSQLFSIGVYFLS